MPPLILLLGHLGELVMSSTIPLVRAVSFNQCALSFTGTGVLSLWLMWPFMPYSSLVHVWWLKFSSQSSSTRRPWSELVSASTGTYIPDLLGPSCRLEDLVESYLKCLLCAPFATLLTCIIFFDSWYNLNAELTRFGDREFYQVKVALDRTAIVANIKLPI